MKSENPRIEWSEKSGKQCLRFTFKEMLTAKEAEVAIVEWKEAFQFKMDESIILIWDCRKMRGYESAARTKWTEALKEMKSRIDTIWLISDFAIIRLGASIMSKLSSINIKAISSESQIVI